MVLGIPELTWSRIFSSLMGHEDETPIEEFLTHSLGYNLAAFGSRKHHTSFVM